MSGTQASRLVLLLLAALAVPSSAVAQRDGVLAAFAQFYRALQGTYGDEGRELAARLDEMAKALSAWDREIADAERELRPRATDANVAAALQARAILASLYLDRGRLADALQEFEGAIAIDPTRAAFHRYRGIIQQVSARPAAAADAFRAAWLLQPTDPQDAYRVIVYRSGNTTTAENARALAALAQVEGELVRLARPPAMPPFRTARAIDDDAGGAMGFVPPAYARGFALMLQGSYEDGLAALRNALPADPLVADAGARSEPMTQGITALRQGDVDAAIDRLQAAAASLPASSEAHRVLATAYGVRGDMPSAVRHLREAVGLRPQDERSWIALADALEQTGESADAEAVLRDAVAALPSSGALRWRLRSALGERIDASDADLLAVAERLVLFAGHGALLGQLAAMARGDLNDDLAVRLLEQRVALTPNSASAHRALGRALIDVGAEETGYAELVMALLLDPQSAETLTLLGRLHLSGGRVAQAIAALERALVLAPADSEALHALGSALVRAGRAAEGQKHLDESGRRQAEDVAEQRSRRTAAALTVQAEIHLSNREYGAAVDLWNRAAAVRRESVSPHRLAEALTGAGRLEAAAAVLEAAVASAARPETHRRLAEVYAALGRTAESAREQQMYVAQKLEQLRRGGAR